MPFNHLQNEDMTSADILKGCPCSKILHTMELGSLRRTGGFQVANLDRNFGRVVNSHRERFTVTIGNQELANLRTRRERV